MLQFRSLDAIKRTKKKKVIWNNATDSLKNKRSNQIYLNAA